MRPYIPAKSTRTFWAAKTDTINRLDGRRVSLNLRWWKANKQNHGIVFQLFNTRRECRDWIEYEWGYLQFRPDLRAEPHCWRRPYPVKVTMEVTECLTHAKLTRLCTPASGIGPTKKVKRRARTRRKSTRFAA